MVEEKIMLLFVGIDNTDMDEINNDDDDDSYSDLYPTNLADTSTDDIKMKGKNEHTTMMVWSLSSNKEREEEEEQWDNNNKKSLRRLFDGNNCKYCFCWW